MQNGHPDHQHEVPRHCSAPTADVFILVSRYRIRVGCSINRSQLGNIAQVTRQPAPALPTPRATATYCALHSVSQLTFFKKKSPCRPLGNPSVLKPKTASDMKMSVYLFESITRLFLLLIVFLTTSRPFTW